MPEEIRSCNKLLAGLSGEVYARLRPHFEPYELEYAVNLYDRGQELTHVYFVESGIVSLLVDTGEMSTMEVAMVGSEGMAALPVFLGITISNNRAVVQGSGHALRMTATNFHAECAISDDLPKIMRLFTYSLLMQISRSAVCTRFHSIESRLARWLLMTQDRMQSPDFKITQEFLSYMLGVRREAVSKAAGHLQRRNLVSYVRGHVTILDRGILEGLACNCYGFISAN
jgi:CRP-like cAMP-binding protein